MGILDTELKFLKGVGETRASLLAKELGIVTFRDLLYHFPFRYTDRSRFYSISEFVGNDMPSVQVRGSFTGFSVEGEGMKERLVGYFTDGHRFMQIVWFSGIKRLQSTLQTGRTYILFGKPQIFRESYSMSHPEIDLYDPEAPPEGMRGIYNLTETLRRRGFTQRLMQNIVRNLLDHPKLTAAEVGETLPSRLLEKHHYPGLYESLRALHIPQDNVQMQRATERMKFEELFYIELNILRISGQRRASQQGAVMQRVGEKFNTFYSSVIPFDLTGAQKRVIKEIRADMLTGRQMNRLLQGDVGSGKTMVAFMTMLLGVDNGYQASLMAPTEILATQHYETLREWGDKIGVRVELLTGSTRVKKRREIDAGLRAGSIHILVGTHALLEEKVEFSRLGIAVIDEQHRFGVAQRARMWAKAQIPPHILVMTATPIPRTLAMTVYGDLDVSVIDELPPGRKPVQTRLCYDENREEVYRLMGQELRAGRQVYVVYPLVKENEKLALRSVEEGLERISEIFPSYPVVMVHGQMKPDVKDRAMERFVSGEARIMVATTVIEVGVNVPNASVMVIENAERFGLSQLHQLRGRVGRGADRSYCILMGKLKMGADTRKRLGIMTETSDGFVISEADMELRGPGDMEGTQQSGIPFNLKIASLARDGQMVALARQEAETTLQEAYAGRYPQQELDIYGRELHLRFRHKVDWSIIS